MPSHHSIRGSGITRAQIANLAQGGTFIAYSNQIKYLRVLAKSLGRNDIEIVSTNILCDGGAQMLGREFPDLDMDHFTFASCTDDERHVFIEARQLRCRKF